MVTTDVTDDPYTVAPFSQPEMRQYPFYVHQSGHPAYSPGMIDPVHLKSIAAIAMSPQTSFSSDSTASSPSCSPTAIQRHMQENQRLFAQPIGVPSSRDTPVDTRGESFGMKVKPSKKALDNFKSAFLTQTYVAVLITDSLILDSQAV